MRKAYANGVLRRERAADGEGDAPIGIARAVLGRPARGAGCRCINDEEHGRSGEFAKCALQGACVCTVTQGQNIWFSPPSVA